MSQLEPYIHIYIYIYIYIVQGGGVVWCGEEMGRGPGPPSSPPFLVQGGEGKGHACIYIYIYRYIIGPGQRQNGACTKLAHVSNWHICKLYQIGASTKMARSLFPFLRKRRRNVPPPSLPLPEKGKEGGTPAHPWYNRGGRI